MDHPIAVTPVETCLRCRGRMNPEVDDLTYKRDGYKIIVTGVPMSICEACGERYVPGPVALEISDFVADFVRDLEATMARRDTVQARSFVLRASDRVVGLAPAFG